MTNYSRYQHLAGPALRLIAAALIVPFATAARAQTAFGAPPAGEMEFARARARIFLAEERRDPALYEPLLTHADPLLRARAARAAGRIGAPQAARQLAAALKDADPGVRAGAAWGALFAGELARPLIPALREKLADEAAVRLPALETLVSLGDKESAPLILKALELDATLPPAVAGHLFRIDTPEMRTRLKAWAAPETEPITRYGALYSLFRLKAEDEVFYRGLLEKASGEMGVVVLKGLGLTKELSKESFGAIEAAAKRVQDPLVRIEALSQIARRDFPAVQHLIAAMDIKAADAQIMTAVLDQAALSPCEQKLEDDLFARVGGLIYERTEEGETVREYGLPFMANVKDSFRRRLLRRAVKCGSDEDDIEFTYLFKLSGQCKPPTLCFRHTPESWRDRATFLDAIAEAKDKYTRLLNLFLKDPDPRVRAAAASTQITRGESATPWLLDKNPAIVESAAGAAAQLKAPTEKQLSGKTLLKAYKKNRQADPSARLYIVRAAALCAETQPACLKVLKTAITKDKARPVQINGWERWPEKFLAQRPAWPRPNLPKADSKAVEEAVARMNSLRAAPPRFAVETTQGTFHMTFNARGDSPANVLNFRKLVEKKYFDGIVWHRVVPNFVVQGGDPRGDGSGGPGWMIPCEYNSLSYKTGTVGMALDGKDTGGSQFFVALTTVPHLDFRYTILGQVDAGMEVVYKLGEDDKILSIREVGKN